MATRHRDVVEEDVAAGMAAGGGGLSAQMDDYRTLNIRRGKKIVKRTARLRQDKGHQGEWQSLIDHLTGQGPAPISFAEIVSSTEATLAAEMSLAKNDSVGLAYMS
jgi:hypothetical protein